MVIWGHFIGGHKRTFLWFVAPFFLITKWQNLPPPKKRNPTTIHNSHWYIFYHTFFLVFPTKKIEGFPSCYIGGILIFFGEKNIGQFFSIKNLKKKTLWVRHEWGASIPIIQNGISNGFFTFLINNENMWIIIFIF
jgi:hypothetical protein